MCALSVCVRTVAYHNKQCKSPVGIRTFSLPPISPRRWWVSAHSAEHIQVSQPAKAVPDDISPAVEHTYAPMYACTHSAHAYKCRQASLASVVENNHNTFSCVQCVWITQYEDSVTRCLWVYSKQDPCLEGQAEVELLHQADPADNYVSLHLQSAFAVGVVGGGGYGQWRRLAWNGTNWGGETAFRWDQRLIKIINK